MKLIDRDKLLDYLAIVFCYECDSANGDKCKWCDIQCVFQLIEDYSIEVSEEKDCCKKEGRKNER